MTGTGGVILYNVGVVVVIWLGAFLSTLYKKDGEVIRIIVSFSAGIFLGVSFLHMIPESAEILGHQVGMFVLFGFLILYFLERFAMVHPCDEGSCHYHHIGIAAFLGLSLHSLMNGVALGASLLVPGLGLAVFLATAIHKGPEAFSLTSLLTLGNRSRAKVIAYLVAFSAMVPLGSLIAMFGVSAMGEKAVGAAVALSAGTFLQIATGDLLPETHSPGTHKTKVLLGFVAGIGLTMVGSWLHP